MLGFMQSIQCLLVMGDTRFFDSDTDDFCLLFFFIIDTNILCDFFFLTNKAHDKYWPFSTMTIKTSLFIKNDIIFTLCDLSN